LLFTGTHVISVLGNRRIEIAEDIGVDCTGLLFGSIRRGNEVNTTKGLKLVSAISNRLNNEEKLLAISAS
jgi:hypothetical protein